ncbi:MAG: hypothetical protein R3E34_10300 [Rhodocyclaceae bacterium]
MVFDAAGNLSSYAGKTFTHGGDGRLSTTTTGAGTVTYQYDGFGRRVSKSGPATLVPGGFVRYVYDAAHHLVGEYKANGSPIKEYVWLGDLPVAMVIYNPDSAPPPPTPSKPITSAPRLLTDATRAPRWRWTSRRLARCCPDDPSGLGRCHVQPAVPGAVLRQGDRAAYQLEIDITIQGRGGMCSRIRLGYKAGGILAGMSAGIR